MKFSDNSPLDQLLGILFERYAERVPDVNRIRRAMVDNDIITHEEDIINDHIAFRTLGVQHLGIASFEKIFLHHGYEKRDKYFFEKKKLDAYWYAPPDPKYPRIFLSELRVQDLSENAQKVIGNYVEAIEADPVDALDLDDGKAVGEFLHKSLWELPTLKDYEQLLQESEYAAWVIYNRYYLNHYTISIHELAGSFNQIEKFNAFLEGIGIKLNDSGGKIKQSKDGLLLQSSTVAGTIEAGFKGGEKKKIPGSYVEFAERRVLPAFASLKPEMIKTVHRREGFEASNADKIFESTYKKQVEKG